MEAEKTKTPEIKDEATDLVSHVGDYQLITITLAKKSIDLASSIINFVILAFLSLLFVLFVGLGLSWWLGTVVGNRAGGFFITAGIYLATIIVLVVMRKKLIFPSLRNLLTRTIYE